MDVEGQSSSLSLAADEMLFLPPSSSLMLPWVEHLVQGVGKGRALVWPLELSCGRVGQFLT